MVLGAADPALAQLRLGIGTCLAGRHSGLRHVKKGAVPGVKSGLRWHQRDPKPASPSPLAKNHSEVGTHTFSSRAAFCVVLAESLAPGGMWRR